MSKRVFNGTKLTDSYLTEQLRNGIASMQLDVTADQLDKLLRYLQLFEKWNRAFNLSAVREISDMLSRHVLDSLVVAQYLKGHRFIDVGTGGGLPGIPLAIVFPERHFVLLDSNGKKTRFLFQVKQELALTNVTIEQSRVENYQSEHLFDGVISRAFASLDAMLAGSRHLLTSNGCYFAMKGQRPDTELDSVPVKFPLLACEALSVPGCEAERHLIIIGQASI